MITADELHNLMPFSAGRAATYCDSLNAAMAEFEINNIGREAAFLAQIAHESGELRYVRELASGEAYEGRADLGNDQPGDGVRYKGRGLIQITGKANYRACGDALGVDLVAEPEKLEQPVLACRSAGWFWKAHNLNELADADNFREITRRINGGYNGYKERLAYYSRAQNILT